MTPVECIWRLCQYYWSYLLRLLEVVGVQEVGLLPGLLRLVLGAEVGRGLRGLAGGLAGGQRGQRGRACR